MIFSIIVSLCRNMPCRNKQGENKILYHLRKIGESMFIWYVLLGLTVLVSVAVASLLLPKMFLQTRYTIKSSVDRGLKKIIEKNGQSMVFQPALKWRKYINQYVLAERSGVKQLMCKLNTDITYISYDIVLFNSEDKVFDVLTVKDLVEKNGFSKVVELPEDTSYVSLVVNEVDGMSFPDHITGKAKAGKVAKFLVACSFMILLELLFVKVCCANLFGGVFKESFVLNVQSTLVTLLIAGILIIVNIIVSLITVKVRGAKKSGWSK